MRSIPLACDRLEDRTTPAGGILDPDFGVNGTVLSPLDGGARTPDEALAVAVQPDGRIVLAGYAESAGQVRRDFVVERLLPDGRRDLDFGVGGRVLVQLPRPGVPTLPNGEGRAVAIAPDGRIVLAGTIDGFDLTVVRLNPDGSFDTSFDADGRAAFAFGSGGRVVPSAVAVLPDQRVVVAGAGLEDFAVLRLLANGQLDTSFGNLGRADVGFDDPALRRVDAATDLAVRPDGRIVVVGSALDSPLVQVEIPATQMAIAQLTPDGRLDGSFGVGGRRLVSFGLVGRTDVANAVALQPDGRIVVGGQAAYTAPFAGVAPLGDMAAVRLNPDGSLDPSFDGDGRVVVPFGVGVQNRDSRATAVVVQPSGRVTLAGSAVTPTGGSDFAVAQLGADGAPDTTFGTDGRAVVNLSADGNGPTRDTAYRAAVQAPGRLVVAGSAAFNPPPPGGGVALVDAAVARFIVDSVTPGSVLAGGAAGGSTVVLVPTAGTLAVGPGFTFAPGFTGGARTAAADITGDGIPDLIGGAGPGGPPTVAIYDGKTGAQLARFDAFESSFRGGTFVSAGDLDGDGRAEVVVTPDRGGGPVVAVYRGSGLATFAGAGSQIVRFFGIDDPAFRGGARSAIGDVNGDGTADLAVAAGFGGGPRVALFNGADVAAGSATPQRLVGDFFAFENTLRNGAFVAAGDADGDGAADLAFGAGPGGGPRVRVFGGRQLLAAGGFNSLDEIAATARLADFFAGDPALRGGVRVAFRELDGNGRADLVTGSGDNEPSRVRVFANPAGLTAPTPAPTRELDPFGAVLPGGVFVG